MKKRNGFTIVEFLIALVAIVAVALGCVVLYAGWHFVAKYW